MVGRYVLASLVLVLGALSCELDEGGSESTDAGLDASLDAGPDASLDGGPIPGCDPVDPVEGPGTAPPNAPCDEDSDCQAMSCRDPAMNPDEGCTCRNLEPNGCPAVDVAPGSVAAGGACDLDVDCADGLPCLDCTCIGGPTDCADVVPGSGEFGAPCRNDDDCLDGLPCCTSTDVSEACGVQVGLCECI